MRSSCPELTLKAKACYEGVGTLASGTALHTPHSHLLLSATFTWGDTNEKTLTSKTFLDSGAADIFLTLNWQR